MKSRAGIVAAALCVASLCDVSWVRTAEQVLVPALFLGEDILSDVMPDVRAGLALGLADDGSDANEAIDADARAADQAWTAWVGAVAQRPPLPRREVAPFVVSVESYDAGRREIILQVPDVELEVDSPVTHRGVLLGFLRPWSSRDEQVVVGGQARVALLGHARARAVAATWEDGSMRFLVASRQDEPTVVLRSRRIRPLPGQLALSRNASALGDTLPAGLALGRVAPQETDLPGGAVALHTRDEPALELLLDPGSLALVAIEAPVEADLTRRALQGRLLRTLPGAQRWHLDQGLAQGVTQGDDVIQGHRWVGRVESAGPFSAIVSRALPRRSLLVSDPAGQLVPVGLNAGAWPVDWQPQDGLAVFCGLPNWGGLAVGRLGPLDHGRLTVDLGDFDPSQPVTVLSR